MNGEDHTRALGALQTGIVGSNGFVKRLVGVSSNLIFDVAAPLWIDVVAVARRVDLDVMHSFIHERLNLCFNNGHDVPEESRVARINLVADTLLVVDRRKLIGGWQGNLYVTGAVLLQEGELVLGQTAGLFDFAHYNSRHARDLGRRASGARLPRAQQVITLVETLNCFVEVAHKVMAAEFAVSEY